MAMHTKGPWWRDDDGFIAAGSGDTYVTVADFDCGSDIDIAEREANKTLAIAAPDMLAALRAQEEASAHAAAVSAATPDGHKPSKSMMDKSDHLFARARRLRLDAIAKAEGR